MNIHGIEKDSMVNGSGIRVVLWVSGCGHNCKGCHNPQTHDPNSGFLFRRKHMLSIVRELKKDYVAGLTLSGGDPLYPSNRKKILRIVKSLKEGFPTKDIWLYTGFTFEAVKDIEIMKYVDVVVDGRFKKELADVNYPWAGSTNQRVIDVQRSLKEGAVVLWQNEECLQRK